MDFLLIFNCSHINRIKLHQCTNSTMISSIEQILGKLSSFKTWTHICISNATGFFYLLINNIWSFNFKTCRNANQLTFMMKYTSIKSLHWSEKARYFEIDADDLMNERECNEHFRLKFNPLTKNYKVLIESYWSKSWISRLCGLPKRSIVLFCKNKKKIIENKLCVWTVHSTPCHLYAHKFSTLTQI